MERWATHEKHDRETRKVMSDLGFVDSEGLVRKFDGRTFWPALKASGHTKMAFNECDCARKGHLRLVK